MKENRDRTWDYARGVAMVMIVIHHLYARFFESPDGQPDTLVSLCCRTMQLPIFMYVSGMFALRSISRYGFWKLLENRAVRLLLPFLSFMLIWSVIRPEKAGAAWVDNFKDGYWFTFVLFEMMAAMAFASFLSRRWAVKEWCTVVGLFGVLTAYKALCPEGNVVSHVLSINLLWHYLPFFLLGYYHRLLERVLQMRYAAVYAVIYVVALFFYVRGHQLAVPLCNLFSLLLLITLFKNGWRPLETILAKIGVFSLQIYLLHFFFRLLIPWVPVVESAWLAFICDVVMASVIVACCIFVAQLLMKSKTLAMLLFGIRQK